MAAKNPLYDLTLLLSSSADEDQKKKILADVDSTIRQNGEVVSTHDWGVRPTTFEIRKQADAEYHLVQFHGGADLLNTLDRTLKITDGVQRFRIIKLKPGVGSVPDNRVAAQAAAEAADPDLQDRGDRADREEMGAR